MGGRRGPPAKDVQTPTSKSKRWSKKNANRSNIELLVERDAVLATMRLVVVDEPPDIERLGEVALDIVELDRPLQHRSVTHLHTDGGVPLPRGIDVAVDEARAVVRLAGGNEAVVGQVGAAH